MDFQMMVVTLIIHRLYGRVIFFHTTKSFSWFFSYSQSKVSWRPLGLQPTAKMRLHSHLGQGAENHSTWSRQRGLPSPEPAPWRRRWDQREGVTGTGLWILLSSFRTGTCCHLVPITASVYWDSPTEAPRWKTELRPCVLGVRRMFPAYHNYRNICAQQFPAELLWKFTVFDCFQNFSLLSLRQGGLKAASELLQEVREITVSRVWMKCGIRVWEVSLEPCVLQTSIDWSILPSLLIQSTYTCWAWCELTLRWIKIWVRVCLQRVNNLVRSNQWTKMIQIIKYYLFGNQQTPLKWQPCIIYIY